MEGMKKIYLSLLNKGNHLIKWVFSKKCPFVFQVENQ